MPAIYISKYNRFVDNIVGRINRILGKSYDPVRVKLQSGDKNNNNKGNKKDKGKKKKNGVQRNPQRDRMTNKMGQLQIARAAIRIAVEGGEGRSIESESQEPSFILISKAGTAPEQEKPKNRTSVITENRARPIKVTGNANNANKKKNGTKATATNNTNKNQNNKNKTKQSNKNKAKVRATLFGLSSIKRDGDVTVNMMSDHTTVKTNFILGPLTLRVERETGSGARRELKSATATTTEMYGRLNLRIIHGGAATLHSIRVLQPKQVRVDSQDNHDKTREFMWRRSSNIASVVSKQLAAAAKSMLKPPPSYST